MDYVTDGKVFPIPYEYMPETSAAYDEVVYAGQSNALPSNYYNSAEFTLVKDIQSNTVVAALRHQADVAKFQFDIDTFIDGNMIYTIMEKSCERLKERLSENISVIDSQYSYMVATISKMTIWAIHYFATHDAGYFQYQFSLLTYGPLEVISNPAKNTFSKHSVSKKSSKSSVAKKARNLPAVNSIVNCPAPYCDKGSNGMLESLYGIIIHLNDSHKWSRESIADWIDELHDKGEINAEFESWNEEGVTKRTHWKRLRN